MSAADEVAESRVWVRLPNWVGDVCMALPTLHYLAQAGLQPVLVGKPWAVDLLAGHGWPVVALPTGGRAVVRALRPYRAWRGLLLTNSFSSAGYSRLAGIQTLGYAGDARRGLLARALPRPTQGHEVMRFWRLAQAMVAWCEGLPAPRAADPPATLGLQLTAQHRAQAGAALARVRPHPQTPYVVLAPWAAGRIGGRSKMWPEFARLARWLQAQGVMTVVCPGPAEVSLAHAAAPGAMCLGGLSLGAYAAVCQGACLTVANDSGPMHLAAAVGAPVLGLFGPGTPERTAPWAPGACFLGGAGHWPSWVQVMMAVRYVLQRSVGASSGLPNVSRARELF